MLVMKPANGARSSGVRLVEGHVAQLHYARKLSSTFNIFEYLKNMINTIIRKNYRKKSLHRRKFIVQEFIPGLDGDFKVLIYGKKYYVLTRKNRKNDFSASGSGIFSFPESLPTGLLDYAYEVFTTFNVPFISLDIAHNGKRFDLIEFQFLSFGNYTLERSKFYFARSANNIWTKIEEKPNLEREFSSSVAQYLNMKGEIG
jgi:glutathione synthase/RimK-type ligase-like ATP-grasp enzyme